MKRLILFFLLAFSHTFITGAEENVYSNKGWSFSFSGGADYLIPANDELKGMLGSSFFPSWDVRAGYGINPADAGSYTIDYNFPTIGFGIGYSNLHALKYTGTSHLNNILDIYSFVERDIVKTRKFSFGYEIQFGLGLSNNKYDPCNNPLNEIINSKVTFDIGGSPFLKWRPVSQFELSANLRFKHHSFGKLTYPNSGINEVVASVSAKYYLESPYEGKAPAITENDFEKGFKFEILAGGGVNRCVEEWDVYNKMEPDPGRKVSTINAFPKYFLSFISTWRYARKFSSGLGLDLFCSSKDWITSLKDCETVLIGPDAVNNHKYSPFSCGISAIQNFHYRNFAIWGCVGIYLFNRVGASQAPRHSYQRIGIKYSFPKISDLTLSMCCKTHFFSQAEMMEFGIGFKI